MSADTRQTQSSQMESDYQRGFEEAKEMAAQAAKTMNVKSTLHRGLRHPVIVRDDIVKAIRALEPKP